MPGPAEEVGPFYHGERGRQGKAKVQSEAAIMASKLVSGKRLMDVMLEHPAAYMRNCNGAKAIASAVMPRRRGLDSDVPEVFVIFGEPGQGKTRSAWAEAIAGKVDSEGLPDPTDVYVKDGSMKWWDQYEGQSSVIIDELDSRVGSVNDLKRWLDRYPVNVEVKGAVVPFAAKKIWITSNHHPRDWWPNLKLVDKKALNRRFTKITRFNPDGTKDEIRWDLSDDQDTDSVVDPALAQLQADAARFL